METVVKIISGTLIGTSAMTAFSYYLSYEFRKKFQEPRLLTYVMQRIALNLPAKSIIVASWFIHYLLGLLFVIAYHLLWNCCFEFNWLSTLAFGCVSGLIGIFGWIVIFSLPSEKPKVAYTSYFIQLFFAHIILAFGVFLTYKIIDLY